MAKTITHDLVYDAPLERVAAMLADPAFREEVCDFQGVLRRTVTITDEADGRHVTIDQVQPAAGIPSFAARFVGDEINIVQKEIWHSDADADIFVEIPGKPGDMKGGARLVENGGTTTETVTLTVKVGIPLVGGKIEGLIAEMLVKALRAENKVGVSWLLR
ncbi:DUF2505 domain-containing protein [Nocardioides sp. SYSU D00038]|uniref:DUF2505 domain-containing protein n=1 Tax=Nocardioides sp. SYSU D00038 TaxID=2812554 RepID=UPI00196821C9|nr:DUF2505 domain-containing protein [Nocardioides sp. SYSU D00038]